MRDHIIFCGADNTIYMNKTINAIKRALPTAALVTVIALLIGLAFLPSVRGGGNAIVASNAQGRDSAAIAALDKCEEYASNHAFSTRLTGTVKASVLGVPYTVKAHGGRTVNGNEFSDVTESVSAAVKFGQTKRCKNGRYEVMRGKYDGDGFKYGTPTAISRDEYIRRYGMPPIGLTKYITDGTIVSAAQVDEHTFTYTLDAARATEYYRCEGKTVLGCSECPTYESVTITLVTDGERAIKITAEEKLRAPKFGGINCTATFTEVYEYN